MKKIVFCPITLQPKDRFTAVYSAQQKEFFDGSTYKEKIYYPVNVVLANELKQGDEVKLVLIKTKDEGREDCETVFKENSEKFINELKTICEEIGAVGNIENPVIIDTQFKETQDIFEERFIKFFDVLEEDAEIYADITFGPRVFSMIMMDVLRFAEKFFNADLKSVVYGQTSFNNGKASPGTVYDISSLYFLNNITNVLKADSGAEAIQAFKNFLNS